MSRTVLYTASVITLDGSDTNAYGEACEPGHGYHEDSGWFSPQDESWSVHRTREQVQPDIYPAAAGRDPARWLADQLTDRLGPIGQFDGVRSFYGADELIRVSATAPAQSVWTGAIHDPRRGLPVGAQTLTVAGHAHGFTRQEILRAAHLLGLLPAIGARPASARPFSALSHPPTAPAVPSPDEGRPPTARRSR